MVYNGYNFSLFFVHHKSFIFMNKIIESQEFSTSLKLNENESNNYADSISKIGACDNAINNEKIDEARQEISFSIKKIKFFIYANNDSIYDFFIDNGLIEFNEKDKECEEMRKKDFQEAMISEIELILSYQNEIKNLSEEINKFCRVLKKLEHKYKDGVFDKFINQFNNIIG